MMLTMPELKNSSTSKAFASVATRLRLTPAKIDIQLAGQRKGSTSSYTTGDHVYGITTIEVNHKVQFDDVQITLEGKVIISKLLLLFMMSLT